MTQVGLSINVRVSYKAMPKKVHVFFSFFEPARLENSVKGIVHPKIKMYSPSS